MEDLDEEWDNVDDLIAADQTRDIRHEAIDVPTHGSPFTAEQAEVFFEALSAVKEQGIIPAGFELDVDGYPVRESIHLGRGGKRVSVILPFDIWWPRALLWAQGLDLMTRMLVEDVL